ncbi:hypothetical protein EON80_11210 [bacterium]|nr:MAG: hypothetical protein EON80_11210 [bacterium]
MKKSTLVLAASLLTGITHVAHAQPAPLNYSQVRLLAKQDLEAEKYEAAEKDALQMIALADSPDEAEWARMILGQSFYLRKMYEPARAEWNKLLTANPAGTEATVTHLLLARSYSADGNFAKAIPHYEAGIAGFDKDAEEDEADKPQKKVEPETLGTSTILSLGLANAYYHTEQYELAQKQLEKVTKLTEGVPILHMIALTRTSEIDFSELRLKQAVAGFDKIVTLKEDAPSLKQYAKLQSERASSWLRNNGEGTHGIQMRVNLENSAQDKKMNSAIQALIDTLVDGAIVGALEE